MRPIQASVSLKDLCAKGKGPAEEIPEGTVC